MQGWCCDFRLTAHVERCLANHLRYQVLCLGQHRPVERLPVGW